MRRSLLPLIALALGLASCAYYNGMYNTKRLAGQARKAERQGRTFEATSLWGQVAVKAESVLARHGDSKWADEARFLWGTALVKLRDCGRALKPLETVMYRSPDQTRAEAAAALVGGCRETLGDPAGAVSAYERLIRSQDPELRSDALYGHGRALLLAGDDSAALAELEQSHNPRARGERAVALASLDRVPEATRLADSLLAARDTLAPWDSLLAVLGRRDPDSAAALTARIVGAEEFSKPVQIRVLLQDADRWWPRSRDSAEARFSRADQLARGTPLLWEVRYQRVVELLGDAESLLQIREYAARLEDATVGGDAIAPLASQLLLIAHQVTAAADSVVPGSPGGDLRLFIAAELARDSLGAPRFAGQTFRRVVTQWPDSPFAPKAILALIPLEPASADSLRQALVAQYPTSPYLLVAQGTADPQYRVLEDSLRQFAATLRLPEAGRVGPSQPVPTRQPRPSPRDVNR